MLSQRQYFVQHDDLNIVVVGGMHKIQIAVDSDFDGAGSRSKVSDSVGALKQYRGALRVAHHEDRVHQSLLLAGV